MYTFISGNWAVYVLSGINTWSPNLCEKSCHNASIDWVWATSASAPVQCVSYTSEMASINDFDAVCTATPNWTKNTRNEFVENQFTLFEVECGTHLVRNECNCWTLSVVWPHCFVGDWNLLNAHRKFRLRSDRLSPGFVITAIDKREGEGGND